MDNKDFKEDLKKLKNILEDIEKLTDTCGDMDKAIDEAFKEEAKISIEKTKDGKSNLSLNGSALGLLITLAGLEQAILEKTGVPYPVWKEIKRRTGVREAD